MLKTFLKFSIFTTEGVQIIFTNVKAFNQLVFIDVQTHYTAPVLYIHRALAAIDPFKTFGTFYQAERCHTFN